MDDDCTEVHLLDISGRVIARLPVTRDGTGLRVEAHDGEVIIACRVRALDAAGQQLGEWPIAPRQRPEFRPVEFLREFRAALDSELL